MSDNKLLQAILDGQTSIKKEVGDLKEEMKRGFENVNERLDKLQPGMNMMIWKRGLAS